MRAAAAMELVNSFCKWSKWKIGENAWFAGMFMLLEIELVRIQKRDDYQAKQKCNQ